MHSLHHVHMKRLPIKIVSLILIYTLFSITGAGFFTMSKDKAKTTAVRRSVFLKVRGKELSLSRIKTKNLLEFS